MPAANGSQTKKWDWDLAFALYCGGMTIRQIIETEWFKGLTEGYCSKHAAEAQWKSRRETMRQRIGGDIALSLTDRLSKAADEHQRFILDEVEKERAAFQKHHKGTKFQLERLQILEKLDNVARKTLRLDEQKPINPIEQNFAILVYLQSHHPTGAKGPLSGILRSKNAIPDGALEAIEQGFTEPGPEEGMKVLNGHVGGTVNQVKHPPPNPDAKPMPLGLFKNAAPIQSNETTIQTHLHTEEQDRVPE